MKSSADAAFSPLHLVLVEPEIPQNTGNIGRTCVGLGAPLHLVGELGFDLSERRLRRAGMDYWDELDCRRHESWDDFLQGLPPDAQLLFLSTRGTRLLWNVDMRPPLYLVFGSESRGLPPSFYDRYADHLARIPIRPGVRSLNLATAAGVAAYEAARRFGLGDASSVGARPGRNYNGPHD